MIGLTTSAGSRIDLTNLYVQSLTYVAGQADQPGTLILYANPNHTGEVAQLSMQLIDPEGLVRLPNDEQTLATGDFSLSGNGHGGTLVTYAPQGVTLLEASMPVPVVAATGSRVSLASILTELFGTDSPGFYGIKLVPAPVWHNVSTDDGYWSSPNVTPEWYINDVKVTKPTVITSIDGVELRVGNQIVNPAHIQFQVTPAGTGTNAEYVTYDVWSVDPTVAQLVSQSGAIPGK